ncbi:MAG: EAL domain-containing protein [Pseudomonadota bacterium]
MHKRIDELEQSATELSRIDTPETSEIQPSIDADKVPSANEKIQDSKIEASLAASTNFDSLTGLPTRHLLADRFTQVAAHARRNGSTAALLILNLDRFKRVNDSFGPDLGDSSLKAIAIRLQDALRETDTIARSGGDEFIILLSGLQQSGDENVVIGRLLDTISQAFVVDGHELYFSCSIGASVFPGDGEDLDTLLKHAGTAMYRAKEEGGNGFQFYAKDMSKRAAEQIELTTALRRALAREEFELYYQPKLSLKTGRIVGLEALIRWHHPDRGMISPAAFIPIAEETGLIVPMGAWVMRTACAQTKAWMDAGLSPLAVAVNVSARQARQPEALINLVGAVLHETGLEAKYLELELTESLVMHDPQQFIATVRRLKALGVKLAIDDFGTGYSSLSYLKQFPVDCLKIDLSFIREVTSNPDDAAIVQAIVSLGHNLGLRVIGEGVETEGQLAFLMARNCDEIQGYFFSRPIPAAEIELLLAEGRGLPNSLLHNEGQPRTLLIVDDEENILSSLKRLLHREGYRILTATSGQAGLELLAKNTVDVIISDQRMPNMIGTEFLRRVKEMYPDTVRIMLSGYSELQLVAEAVNEGAIYKFLTKPWNDEQLRDHINEAFRRKALADDNLLLHEKVQTANAELATANANLQELIQQKQEEIVRDEISLDIAHEALQHVPVSIIGIDLDGMVVFFNADAAATLRRFHLMLGLDVAEMLPTELLAVYNACNGQECLIDLDDRTFRTTCRLMGEKSRSRGKLLVLVPCDDAIAA